MPYAVWPDPLRVQCVQAVGPWHQRAQQLQADIQAITTARCGLQHSNCWLFARPSHDLHATCTKHYVHAPAMSDCNALSLPHV